jgi:hypothetical protein
VIPTLTKANRQNTEKELSSEINTGNLRSLYLPSCNKVRDNFAKSQT